MLRKAFKSLVIVSAMVLMAASPSLAKDKMKNMKESPKAVELREGMRKLWEDHITWTRCYIISAVAGLDDAGKVAERLLKNQDDIGDAIKPVYGNAAGKKLSALLRDHIMVATEVVTAAKAGDADELAKANKKWYANADEITDFLSGANPNWSRKDLKDMLYKHLEYTTQEVVSRLKKDWSSDIEAYDKGHMHMLMFADMLAKGMVKQFPKKF